MSRISHRYKFIFFAFPKTGSESIRKILDPYSDIKAVNRKDITIDNPFYTHITPEETQKIFKEKGWNYDDYYKFTCVRNPFSRLVSLYNMTRKNKKSTPSFTNWLIDINPKSKERGSWISNGQLSFKEYISSTDGDILVDKVIKLENINIELENVLRDLNIKNEVVPHINKGKYKKNINRIRSSQKLYRLFYNVNTIEFVSKHFKWEMEQFDYRF